MSDTTGTERLRARLRMRMSGRNRELMRASGDRPVRISRYPRLRTAAALAAYQAQAEPALPYPQGWFCVGLSREWPPGQVRTRPFMGREVVLYRTRRGVLRAIGPYCPHLGAHLGVGGRIEGENLVCPYHGYAYATDGVCVHTPNAPAPKATLEREEVREFNGMVYAWHSADGAPPAWEIVAEPLEGYHRPVWRTYELASHPQEVLENLVDYDHSMTLHGLSIQQTQPPVADGPHFHVDLRVGRRASLLGELVVEHPVDLYGLGHLQLRFELPQYGMSVRNWFLPTPVAPWRIHLRVVGSCKVTVAKRLPPALRELSNRQLSHLASYLVMQELIKITHADRPIWQHKRYQPHPRLSKADGPIGPYRHWARQFYPATVGTRGPAGTQRDNGSADIAPPVPPALT
ncbi:Rieske 2Fe-2S domain-containing protein [Streptomyces sp. NPDC059003]|uniref:Rieske 2Fe-2S domain-containing protein n=1 Tax=Streptomyces sp. NPDC059003 TaxID=3346691 RepID=UPI00369B7E33